MHPDLVRIATAAELDRELVALKREKTRFEDDLSSARAEAAEAVSTRDRLLQEQSDNTTRQRELQRSIERYEARRESAERVLTNGGGDPEAAERQIIGCTEQLDLLETQVLECMETADRLETEIAAAKEAVQRTTAVRDDREARHEYEITRLRNAFHEILPRRDAELEHLDRETRSKYLGLRDRKGSAVAEIQRNSCGSCRMVVQQQHLADLKRGLIIPCRGCGRWLLPEETAEEQSG